jgi:UDP-N-acetylmuramoyl-L-alanyl-D-glutamate--2,6-diaminopimelate ligase
MIPGITSTPFEVIMDRRQAIHKAISLAERGDAVVITGKGTDPYIMAANGKKIPWSDAKVAQEELEKVLD